MTGAEAGHRLGGWEERRRSLQKEMGRGHQLSQVPGTEGFWGYSKWGKTGTAGHPKGLSSFFPAAAQDSPINKLLYARDIPRYKRMVER